MIHPDHDKSPLYSCPGPKTHQCRLIALDPVTVGILTEHRDRCGARAEACDTVLRSDGYVLCQRWTPASPFAPDSISRRFRRLTQRLGIQATIQSLRHFMGTMMLSAGTDLRTVAGRLGHADGGSTTLRVYTHFLPPPTATPNRC